MLVSSSRWAGLAVCAAMGLGASAASAAEKTAYLSLSGGAAIESHGLKIGSATDSTTGQAFDGEQDDLGLSLDTGAEVAPAVGVYVNQLRLEFQYTAQVNEISERTTTFTSESTAGKWHSNLFMLNAYLDFPIVRDWSVYVGGGLGCNYFLADARTTSDDTQFVENQTGASFAYQVMAGVEYQINPMLSVFAGYRGWQAMEVRTQFANWQLPWTHIIEAGLRISF